MQQRTPIRPGFNGFPKSSFIFTWRERSHTRRCGNFCKSMGAIRLCGPRKTWPKSSSIATSRIEDYRGKYVLLDFWATWCAPCLAEMPKLKETYESFAKDGQLVMIGVSLDEKIDAPKRFVAAREIPWLQVFVEGTRPEAPRDDP
jgi:thiol-disulfide isomerase/thioredoxin